MVDGPNLYAYVTNNPLNWIDPYGFEKQGLWAMAKGFVWEGPKDMVVGLWDTVTHPIESAKGIYTAVTHPVQTWEGIKGYYGDEWATDQGKGKIGFDVATLLIAPAKLGKIGKVGEFAKIADKTADVANLADKASDVGKIASNANTVLGKMDDVAGVTKELTKAGDLVPTHGMTQSKTAFNKLKQSINEQGIQEPIKYVESGSQKYVVDGHHRLKAAKELGMENVPTQKVELPFKGYKTKGDLDYDWTYDDWRVR